MSVEFKRILTGAGFMVEDAGGLDEDLIFFGSLNPETVGIKIYIMIQNVDEPAGKRGTDAVFIIGSAYHPSKMSASGNNSLWNFRSKKEEKKDYGRCKTQWMPLIYPLPKGP